MAEKKNEIAGIRHHSKKQCLEQLDKQIKTIFREDELLRHFVIHICMLLIFADDAAKKRLQAYIKKIVIPKIIERNIKAETLDSNSERILKKAIFNTLQNIFQQTDLIESILLTEQTAYEGMESFSSAGDAMIKIEQQRGQLIQFAKEPFPTTTRPEDQLDFFRDSPTAEKRLNDYYRKMVKRFTWLEANNWRKNLKFGLMCTCLAYSCFYESDPTTQRMLQGTIGAGILAILNVPRIFTQVKSVASALLWPIRLDYTALYSFLSFSTPAESKKTLTDKKSSPSDKNELENKSTIPLTENEHEVDENESNIDGQSTTATEISKGLKVEPITLENLLRVITPEESISQDIKRKSLSYTPNLFENYKQQEPKPITNPGKQAKLTEIQVKAAAMLGFYLVCDTDLKETRFVYVPKSVCGELDPKESLKLNNLLHTPQYQYKGEGAGIRKLKVKKDRKYTQEFSLGPGYDARILSTGKNEEIELFGQKIKYTTFDKVAKDHDALHRLTKTMK